MNNIENMRHQVIQIGFLPLFYHDDIICCKEIAMALFEAGVKCIEFTNRGDQALENFKQLVKLRDEKMKGVLLAIGTIQSGTEARAFIDAGADFLISHVFDNSVCDVVMKENIFWIPGCTTPTEIHIAQQAGCRLIKLFPGNVLGPGYVESIRPLFRGVEFSITGGVEATEENIGRWFSAGVKVVGMGSKLISKELVQKKDFETLKKKTRDVISIIERIKSGS